MSLYTPVLHREKVIRTFLSAHDCSYTPESNPLFLELGYSMFSLPLAMDTSTNFLLNAALVGGVAGGVGGSLLLVIIVLVHGDCGCACI